jgi:SAM-dependent methyltransferase
LRLRGVHARMAEMALGIPNGRGYYSERPVGAGEAGGRFRPLHPDGREAEENGMKDARRLWFRPDHAGWNPQLYERFFDTVLGRTLRAREELTIFDFLSDVLERSHSVLEVGCGTGNFTVPVGRLCARTVAVDASPEMLRYTRERLDREGLSGVETRLDRLPGGLGPVRSFDGTLAIGVLNYIRDIEGALWSLASSLKPGGWAVFNVPARSLEGRVYAVAEFFNRRRIYLYSVPEIVDLGKKVGLNIEATATAGLSQGGITVVVGATKPGP